tara:strand:- start:67 stop:372 length:306 start_codon:yes stop_codon:yes gene_type:complete
LLVVLFVLSFLGGLVDELELAVLFVLSFLEGLVDELPVVVFFIIEFVLLFELLLALEFFEKFLLDLDLRLSVLLRVVLLFLDWREFLLIEAGFFMVLGFSK